MSHHWVDLLMQNSRSNTVMACSSRYSKLSVGKCIILIAMQMSRRKLGLHVSKGYSGQKKFCLNPHQLIIKLPVSTYTHAALPDNKALQERIIQYGDFLEDWAMMLVQSLSTTGPFLSPLLCCTDFSCMITVAPDGSWTLSVGRSRVTVV